MGSCVAATDPLQSFVAGLSVSALPRQLPPPLPGELTLHGAKQSLASATSAGPNGGATRRL